MFDSKLFLYSDRCVLQDLAKFAKLPFSYQLLLSKSLIWSTLLILITYMLSCSILKFNYVTDLWTQPPFSWVDIPAHDHSLDLCTETVITRHHLSSGHHRNAYNTKQARHVEWLCQQASVAVAIPRATASPFVVIITISMFGSMPSSNRSTPGRRTLAP